MELRQLVYFDAVVRCGGFTRAAEHLHVAQPAISAQVRKLERELGVELLLRGSGSVALTEAGAGLLDRTRAVLACVDDLTAEARSYGELDRGHVRIGTTPLLGNFPFVATIARFRSQFPAVTVSVRSALADELIAELAGGDLDLVIAPRHPLSDGGIHLFPLAAERLVLITPPDSDSSINSLEDVQTLPFVSLTTGSGLRALLDTAFKPLGVAPRVEFVTSSPANIRDMVSKGLGVALLAHSAASTPGPPVRLHEPAGLPPHPEICLYRPTRPNTPAVAALASHLVAERTIADSSD